MEPPVSSDTPPPPISPMAYKAYQHTNGASMALVEEHLPLVRQVVGRIKMSLPPHIDADDLHSMGVMGLIAASQRYVPQEGRTFAGYAYTRIRGAILDELRRLDWCPRRTRAKARKIKDAIAELEQKKAHIEATLAELRRIHAGPVQLVLDASARAGLQKSLATVQRIVQRHGGMLHAEAAPGQGATFCFTLPGEASPESLP